MSVGEQSLLCISAPESVPAAWSQKGYGGLSMCRAAGLSMRLRHLVLPIRLPEVHSMMSKSMMTRIISAAVAIVIAVIVLIFHNTFVLKINLVPMLQKRKDVHSIHMDSYDHFEYLIF